jgi:hypothetical protein
MRRRYKIDAGRWTITVMPGRCQFGARLGRSHGDAGLGVGVVTYLHRTKRAGRKWGIRVLKGKPIRVCG